MAGPLDGDVDDEDALRQQQEHHVDEISRGVFDEDGGEGFYSEDEDEEVDDPEDWVKMGVEDQEEVEAVLGEVRDNFQDEVDLWDTTMVAEYAEDIFAYMEELEVRLLVCLRREGKEEEGREGEGKATTTASSCFTRPLLFSDVSTMN